jgi:hypothetical protein
MKKTLENRLAAGESLHRIAQSGFRVLEYLV